MKYRDLTLSFASASHWHTKIKAIHQRSPGDIVFRSQALEEHSTAETAEMDPGGTPAPLYIKDLETLLLPLR